MAEKGEFEPKDNAPFGKKTVFKKTDSKNGYTIIVDTNGTLIWKHDSEYDKPHILITSEQVSPEYLKYLDEKNISYIVTGDTKIDLADACKILRESFGIERLGIVGGPAIILPSSLTSANP